MLGIGMCFCLRRANRLLPNQFSFPLRPTNTRQRRGYDVSDEEQGDPDSAQGLLNDYDDGEEDEHDTRYRTERRSLDRTSDDEEFGAMQSAAVAAAPSSPQAQASSSPPPPAAKADSSTPLSATCETRAAIFKVEDDEDEDEDEGSRQINGSDANGQSAEQEGKKKSL